MKQLIHKNIELMAELLADKTAVVFAGQEFSYQYVNESANRLAHYLKSHGVTKRSLVGVVMNRSEQMIISILAILKTGAAYVPLDPKQPKNRLDLIVEISKITCMITQSDVTYENDRILNLIKLDEIQEELKGYDSGNLNVEMDGSELSYIIFTSGSTGVPKGVQIMHRNVIHFLEGISKPLKINADASICAITTITFDMSVLELFASLCLGATMLLADYETCVSGKKLNAFCQKYQPTIMQATPATWHMLLEEDFDPLPYTQFVCGGEAWGTSIGDQLVVKCQKLWNLYGPTETTVWATYSQYHEGDPEVVLGQAIDHVSLYIFDEQKKPVKGHEKGELYIGGKTVGPGYFEDEEKTNKAFIYYKHEDGSTEFLYKTGDIVRVNEKNELVYVERADFQVKIRGFRIELGDIENNINALEEVSQAVCVVKGQDADKYICAYVKKNDEIKKETIFAHLKNELPNYMIPQVIEWIDEFPKTENKKIDRKQLVAMELSEMPMDTNAYIEPETETEKRISEIFGEVLSLKQVSRDGDFFFLGGHSLKATKVLQRIEETFHKRVSMQEFFKRGVVSELASFVDGLEENEDKITPAKVQDTYLMSDHEIRIYVAHEMDDTKVAYNIPTVRELSGDYEIDVLEKDINTLIVRHEVLRTSYFVNKGAYVKKIMDACKIKVKATKCSDLSTYITKNFIKPFDLAKAPLIRVELVQVDEKQYLLFDVHHIIMDGQSVECFVEELQTLANKRSLEVSNVQYKDYIEWLRNTKVEELEKQREYWVNKYANDIPVLNLMTDHKRPQTRSYEGKTTQFHISKQEAEKVKARCKKLGVTENMLMLGTYMMVLAKYSGQEDILVGSPVLGRTYPSIQKSLGMFVNTVVFRGKPEGKKTFSRYMEELKEECLEVYSNQLYPFESLVEEVVTTPDPSRSPMFDVMFTYQGGLANEGADFDKVCFLTKDLCIDQASSKFDISMDVNEIDEGYSCIVEYATSLYTEKTIEKMNAHFCHVLKQVSEHADKTIQELNRVLESEEELLESFHGQRVSYDLDKTLIDRFEEHAYDTPDKAAVIFEDQVLSYQDINERSNQLAAFLLEQKMEVEDIAGVLLSRSPEFVSSVLGIWKARGAYMPMDIEYPVERKVTILSESHAKYLITKKQYVEPELLKDFAGTIIYLDEMEEVIQSMSVEPVKATGKKEDLAYVLFTSGSTGTPKGVMIEQKGMLNHILAERDFLDLNEKLVFAQTANACFDISVWQFFGALALGGTTAIYSKECMLNTNYFLQKIIEDQVTMLELVPSYLTVLLDECVYSDKYPVAVEHVLVTGEACKVDIAKKYFDILKTADLVNAYGPAEASDDVTEIRMTSMDDCDSVPIGKPLSNNQVYIVDQNMQLCPVGVQGEICIGGVGVGRGYINQPEKTKANFVKNPFDSSLSHRLYKTGDLGKWTEDGNIIFAGRADFQVKIRGFRIELEEIENSLLKVAGVKEAVVRAKGSEQLVAYLVLHTEHTPLAESTLKQTLASTLPDYMVPSYFVFLDKMPLLSNGKVNLKALPEVDLEKIKLASYEAPETEMEKLVCEIWGEVLGVDIIGRQDDFFQIGGHSIKAMRVIHLIKEKLGTGITIQEFFANKKVLDMAKLLEKADGKDCRILAAKTRDAYPMSDHQKRIYIAHEMDDTGVTYNLQILRKIKGSYEAKDFERDLNELIKRHESLRTKFFVKNGEYLQKIENQLTVLVKEVMVEDLDAFLKTYEMTAMDLEQLPLLQGYYIHCKDEAYILCETHHIIVDGRSEDVLMEELTQLSNGFDLDEVKLQYKDYSEWYRNELQDEVKRQEEYWISKYQDDIPALDLFTDYPRPQQRSFQGDYVRSIMDKITPERVKAYCQKTGTTEFMFFLGAFLVTLGKYSGKEDILVGAPVSGRIYPEISDTVGMFVNTVVFRGKPVSDKLFATYYEEIKDECLEVYANQLYPFETLVEKVVKQYDLSKNAMFDVMFSYLDKPVIELSEKEKVSCEFVETTDYVGVRSAMFDLSIEVSEKEEGYVCLLEFATALYKKETVERIMAHYFTVISRILENDEGKLREIATLSNKELGQIQKFVGKPCAYDLENTLIHRFEKYAKMNPKKVAVISEEGSLDYRTLNEKANQMAAYLLQNGMEKEQIAGILLPRGIDFMVSVLGSWKALGAYMPLDTDYPVDRVLTILSESQASFLITMSEYVSKDLEDGFSGKIICLDQVRESLAQLSGEDQQKKIIKDQLAYVLFTSGSTGKPKGVMIEHKGMLNHILAEQDFLELKEDLVFAQTASQCFDISVWQFFGALALGGTTAIYSKDCMLNTKLFLEKIIADQVSMLEVVPSYLTLLLDEIEASGKKPKSLLYVLATGEACKKDIAEKYFKVVDFAKLVNAYGPAECSDDVTQIILDKELIENTVPIGKPLCNSQIYIVDENMQLCPIGVTGEICIGGIGVGRGYINQPEKTKASFVKNPFDTSLSDRLYKTGDLGKWTADGNVLFAGRRDFQVKIRGFRIELEEIENCLIELEDVAEAVVDKVGTDQLCAYIVSKNGNVDIEAMKQDIGQKLPAYMVPAYFMVLESLPLSANGKVDRKALPKDFVTMEEIDCLIPPTNALEEALCGMFEEILGTKKVGITDSFFALGGHSLKAVNLVNRMDQTFGVRLQLKDIFVNACVKNIAKVLEGHLDGSLGQQGGIIDLKEKKHVSITQIANAEEKLTLVRNEKQPYYPVSAAQKRMFILNRIAKNSTNYNIPEFYTIKGDLDPIKVEQCFQEIVKRHDSLRTSFGMQGQEIVQYVKDEMNFEIHYEDVEAEQDDMEDVMKRFVRPFKLSVAPLLRVKLCKVGAKEHILLLDVHHICCDGLSGEIMMQEFVELYHGKVLEPLKYQYTDYAIFEKQLVESSHYKESESYWLNMYQEEVPVLELPTAHERGLVMSYEGASCHYRFEKALSEKIINCASKKEATLNMFCLAAYYVLLSKFTGQEDLVVGSPIAGRLNDQVTDMIGMFVNTLALRANPKGDLTFEAFLEQVKDLSMNSFEHQDYPFDQLVEKLGFAKDVSRNPLFDTVFHFYNIESTMEQYDDLQITPMEMKETTSKFDISVTMTLVEDHFELDAEYCTKIYDEAIIQQILSGFEQVFAKIVENPGTLLSQISVLSEKEQKHIVEDFNETYVEREREYLLHELFEEQALVHPDAIAVISEDIQFTYEELNEKANVVARALVEKGAMPNQPVAIMMERGANLIACLMAIMKAGSAYVPIDPNYPMDRKEYLLTDSEAKILLTTSSLCEDIEFSGNTVCMDQIDEAGYERANLGRRCEPNHLAYIIYTSGTTGKPKGVMIEHRNITNTLLWRRKEYGFGVGHKALQTFSSSFDGFVSSLFTPLVSGATVCIYSDIHTKDIVYLASEIMEKGITHMFMIPLLYKGLLQTGLINETTKLQTVTLGGDRVDAELCDLSLQVAPKVELVNEYGPTESSVNCTFARDITHRETITIGKPMDNTCIYIVDQYGAIAPVGVKGEICIAGKGVARGYYHREELTKEKFVFCPYHESGRMYKTGDMGCFTKGGEIAFLGRMDDQVKIRGYRIELGEVEDAVCKLPYVTAGCVIVKTVQNNKQLYGFIVSNEVVDEASVKRDLTGALPKYMIPSRIVLIDKMPTTPNGKVDRKYLAQYQIPTSQTNVELEGNLTDPERKVVQMFKDIIQIDQVGLKDDFFDIGGDSLGMITLQSKLLKEGINISIASLYEKRTVKEIASLFLA